MLQMNVHCSFLRKRNRIVVIKERESHMPHIAAAFLLLLCFCLVCVSPPCNASSLSAPSPHRGVPHDDDEDTMVKLVVQITNNFQNDEDNPDDHRNLPTETRSSNYLKSAAPIIVTNRGTEDQTDDANANSDVNVGDAAPVVVAAPLAPRDGAVFHNPQHDEYQVMLFYYRAQRPPSPDMPNITLVAHATIDRLHAVARWCRTLRGPLSISVFVRPFVDDIATVMGSFVADECIARHADLHLVTERGHRYEPREDGGKDMMTHYPFNVQRNAALDGCVGDLALLMDIDFHLMPVPNNREVDLRRNLVEQQAKMASWSFLGSEPWVRDAAVYVIPAVETMNKRVKVPRTMSELRTGLDDHSVLAFYHTCQTCHRPTDLRRFSRPTTTEAYLIQFEEGYEPYVILNRSSTTPMAAGVKVPRYDETFVGRGWDKMSFFYELALGQQRPFVVLPRYFLVHHGKGDMPKFLTMEYIKRQEVNRALMGMFKERMAELYSHLEADGSAAVTPPPSDATPSSIEQGGGASQPDENCLQHRHGNEQHGRHDASTTLEGKRRASPPQIPVAISDDLLWRSTEAIEWSAMSTTLGFPVSCLVSQRAIRKLMEEARSIEAATMRLEQIVNTACPNFEENDQDQKLFELDPSAKEGAQLLSPRLNCKALGSERGGTPLQSSMRRADWAAERLFHTSLSTGSFASPESACEHVGKGLTVLVHHHRGAGQGGDGEGNEHPIEQQQETVGEETWGCTLHRDGSTVTLEAVHRLLADICGNGDDGDRQDVLGRGTCVGLFSQIHEVVRHDARIQLAVALNAHHFMYHNVPGYKTCANRWGDAAVFVRIPTVQQWR